MATGETRRQLIFKQTYSVRTIPILILKTLTPNASTKIPVAAAPIVEAIS